MASDLHYLLKAQVESFKVMDLMAHATNLVVKYSIWRWRNNSLAPIRIDNSELYYPLILNKVSQPSQVVLKVIIRNIVSWKVSS